MRCKVACRSVLRYGPAMVRSGGGDREESWPVSFGFRDVSAAEKTSLIQDVFGSVAGRYDLMNDLMSGGLHRLWKREMVDWLKPRPGTRLLDLAGGTGDIAFRCQAAAEGLDVTVCDLSADMLAVGRDRAWNQGLVRGLHWVTANAQALPFPDRSFDACTIAFGIRNVAEIEAALGEINRVLRPGGRFMCLEFSPDVLPLLQRAYDLYSFRVIPVMGQAVTGDAESYQYLVESIRRFPPRARFAAMVDEAGFAGVRNRALTGGVAVLTSGWRV